MQPLLNVHQLRKTYKNSTAVDGVSFSVNAGEIVGLLGPNGAGKTTTINMLLGVLLPTAGEISIQGLSLSRQRSQALAQTNFAAIYAPLPGNLTVYQNLKVFGMIYSVPNLKKRIEDLLKEFDLEAFRGTRCGALSSGEQSRVGLAKAMLNRPRLLLLDEPTASMDPSSAAELRARIRAFAKESSVGVLWTSHNMYEVEDVCDRVLFMSNGKILFQGNPKTLPQNYGKQSLNELFITADKEPLSLELR